MKRELATVIDELLAGNLSSGRQYEKLHAGDNLYSVRLSRAFRFVFLLYRTARPLCPSPSVPTTKPTVRP